jgi:hypothetical protein
MYSQTYLRLQNEAYLAEGCLRSALASLLRSNSSERGALYAALFNYSNGLERLLKLCLILDHCAGTEGRLPDRQKIKNFGHDVGMLYNCAKAVADRYQVRVPENCRSDEIDERLIQLVMDFAISGRYFNLDALTGAPKSLDPLSEWAKLLTAIYERDVPPLNEEQVEAVADWMKEFTIYLPGTGFDGGMQSYGECCADHGKITLVMPDVVWRFARLLYPFSMLLFELDLKLRGDQRTRDTFPQIWEVCAFCWEDKESALVEIGGYDAAQRT